MHVYSSGVFRKTCCRHVNTRTHVATVIIHFTIHQKVEAIKVQMFEMQHSISRIISCSLKNGQKTIAHDSIKVDLYVCSYRPTSSALMYLRTQSASLEKCVDEMIETRALRSLSDDRLKMFPQDHLKISKKLEIHPKQLLHANLTLPNQYLQVPFVAPAITLILTGAGNKNVQTVHWDPSIHKNNTRTKPLLCGNRECEISFFKSSLDEHMGLATNWCPLDWWRHTSTKL